MLINLNNPINIKDKFNKFDVVIVGAGPAGITIANKLASYKKKIALIEAGDKEYSDESQELYKGRTLGDPYFELDISRLRYFGGSSGHWAGWCRTFENEDFNREYLGDEFKWPIRFNEIDNYRKEACEILEISNFFNDNMVKNSRIENISFNFSPPVRFGSKYFRDLVENKFVNVFINSNLVDITHSSNQLNAVKINSYNGNSADLYAKNFVFAMGGLENSRYLLWFQRKYGDSFIYNSPSIGRYWMEHPHYTIGRALINKNKVGGRFYTLSPSAQFENQILNCCFRLEHLNDKSTEDLIKNLSIEAPKLGSSFAKMAKQKIIVGAKFRAVWEQFPNFENHIQLDTQMDRFGIPKLILNWEKANLDIKTIEKSISEFRDWLFKIDGGRIQIDQNWIKNPNQEIGGHHHMGGTRMHADKRLGVVDSNCKVYGSKNLFIAGSSIFTTGGHNNPTLPIVQFSIRLSEHLRKL